MYHLLTLALLVASLTSTAQLSIKSQYSQAFGCYEKKGCDAYGEGFNQDLYIQVVGQQLQ